MLFKRLVLTGFMGSGKTQVGRELASLWGWDFVDTDALVEELSGRGIPELFAEGESCFRQWERQAIATLFAHEHVVIATGGGAIADDESRGFLSALGPIVALHAPLDLLWQRAGADASRPLSADRGGFEALYWARKPHYEGAALHVDTGSLTIEAAANCVSEQLKRDEQVQVTLGDRSYKIHVAPGGLCALPDLLGEPTNCLVVSDEHVASLYAEPVMAALRFAGFQPRLSVIHAGEGSKSFESAQKLYDECMRMGLKRHQPIIALGGGVVGDLAGFVAATYQRGVPFVQVPTTLLAQIDSSVGGKVAINHPQGKNMIGAFHQPRLVLADTTTLLTLSEREYRSGLGELVKYGMILDASLFERLERESAAILARDLPILGELIVRSCELKAQVVKQDEREAPGGLRAILNFGHTLGHAIEACAGYGLVLHGEAVAIGMVFAGRLAVRAGRWSKDGCDRLEALLTALGLPTTLPSALDDEALLALMGRDKKNREHSVTFVLPDAIGRVSVQALTTAEILPALSEMPQGDWSWP